MTRTELAQRYSQQVFALDPSAEDWREQMLKLSKQYADDLEGLAEVEKRVREEVAHGCDFCAEEMETERARMDNSALVRSSTKGEKVRGITI